MLAQPPRPEASEAEAEIRSADEVDSKKTNQEAVEKLRRMSKEEIEALDQMLAKALVLYYDREFALALPIFMEIAGKVETMDIMFWLGTSAMKTGEIRLAIQKFKKMLAIDPKLNRVRLELATAYFTLGRHDEARQELELVQAAAPPVGVRKNIEKMLAAIEERSRKVFWNLRLSQGYLWDDNITAGPDQKEYDVVSFLGPGTYTPDEKSAKLKDEAWVTNVAGNVLWDMGEKNGLMWNTTVSFYNQSYFDYSDFNYMAIDIATGPWLAGRSDILKIPFGYTELEYGKKRLSYIFHVDPNYEHHFNQYFSLKGLYSYSTAKYHDSKNSGLDSKKHRFELTPNFYLVNRKHILSATAGYEDHNADVDRFTYDGPYYALSYFTKFRTGIELFFRYQWTRRDYYGSPPTDIDKDREDKRNSYTAVLSQGFFKYFFASLAFSYTDNDSNCDFYTFDRTTYTLSTGCRF